MHELNLIVRLSRVIGHLAVERLWITEGTHAQIRFLRLRAGAIPVDRRHQPHRELLILLEKDFFQHRVKIDQL